MIAALCEQERGSVQSFYSWRRKLLELDSTIGDDQGILKFGNCRFRRWHYGGQKAAFDKGAALAVECAALGTELNERL
jgi:hypothetical protein